MRILQFKKKENSFSFFILHYNFIERICCSQFFKNKYNILINKALSKNLFKKFVFFIGLLKNENFVARCVFVPTFFSKMSTKTNLAFFSKKDEKFRNSFFWELKKKIYRFFYCFLMFLFTTIIFFYCFIYQLINEMVLFIAHYLINRQFCN